MALEQRGLPGPVSRGVTRRTEADPVRHSSSRSYAELGPAGPRRLGESPGWRAEFAAPLPRSAPLGPGLLGLRGASPRLLSPRATRTVLPRPSPCLSGVPSPAAQSGPPGTSAARPPSPSRPAPHRARTAQHGPYGPARPGGATGRGAAGRSIPAWLFQRAPRENRKFASCGPESSPGAPRNANGMERRSGGSGAPRGAAERCGERRGLTSQRHIPSAAPLLSAGRGAPPGTDALPKSCPQNSLSPLRLRRRCDAEVLGRRQRLTPRWLSARSGRGVRRSGAGAHLSDWRPRANGCGRSCLASTALHWPISTA